MFVVLAIGILACRGIDRVYAGRVLSFTPCQGASPYERYEPGQALISINDNGLGGSISWKFCTWKPSPLMHVKDIRIDFTEQSSGVVVASHPIKICDTTAACINQLRQQQHPSCISGSTTLDWLRIPNNDTSASISLMEGTKAIAKFCA